MTDKLIKPGSRLEINREREGNEVIKPTIEGQEILETKINVSGNVNVLNEDSEEGGSFDEKDETVQEQGSGSTTKTQRSQTDGKTAIKALPSVNTMIQETVAAIEEELTKTEKEIKVLMKDKNPSPFILNDKVKRMRFLNGVLLQLKRAAKVAEEYIIGLWKQFVGKTG